MLMSSKPTGADPDLTWGRRVFSLLRSRILRGYHSSQTPTAPLVPLAEWKRSTFLGSGRAWLASGRFPVADGTDVEYHVINLGALYPMDDFHSLAPPVHLFPTKLDPQGTFKHHSSSHPTSDTAHPSRIRWHLSKCLTGTRMGTIPPGRSLQTHRRWYRSHRHSSSYHPSALRSSRIP